MVGERAQRRLAAVLAADVAGYSRLMGVDEEGTLTQLKAHRHALLDPKIEEHRGRIVKTTGDGMLAEFASVVDALRCAVEIQRGMLEQNASTPQEKRIEFRVGINVGDIIFDDGDIYGDGVNIASRLESLARPGGICVPDMVHQMVQDNLVEAFQDLGLQKVKNIRRPIKVWQWTPDAPVRGFEVSGAGISQQVKFCMAPDGVQLAYASVGTGLPVLKAPNWLNHIEYEWRSPIWGPALTQIARRFQLVRFDQRGNGLSDWDVVDISEDAMISDMATVAAAARLGRASLFGISQGCAFSLRYAALYPERVKCLVLLGGRLRGDLAKYSLEKRQLHEATATMIRQGWGSPDPTYRHFFTERFMPDATQEQKSTFDELQRIATSPENAVRIMDMNARVDVTNCAKEIRVPALVLHAEGDRDTAIEEGRRMAAAIPDSHFVVLPGNNHVPIEGTLAFEVFLNEFNSFLSRHGGCE